MTRTRDTAIEWTDKTWNPVTGCTKVSPGCAHCYAEGVAERFWPKQYPERFRLGHADVNTVPVSYYERDKADGLTRPRRFTDVMTHADRLDQPLRWRKPARIFVNSMSDLFHEDVSDEFLHRVYHVMEHARWHTFQVLTKRVARMQKYLSWRYGPREDGAGSRIPSRHIWHGVSVENQLFADERIPLLLQTPAAVRFISAEPLLGPVNLTRIEHVGPGATGTCFLDVLKGQGCSIGGVWPYGRLDWVIVGGESGRQARPCEVAWVRVLVQQCQAAHVPVFVKQLGSDPRDAAAERDDMCARETWPEGWLPTIDGRRVWRPDLSHRKGGDPAEWPAEVRVREYPTSTTHD